jgi:probable rRNA maturation factor
MIFIETIEDLSPAIAEPLVETAALEALRHQAAPEDFELTIVLTDDTQLHDLNKEFLHVDAPTDVLSFPSDQTDPETGSRYLGDILISVERAAAQAAAAGHPVEAEVQLLVVHGVLHIMGHDHAEPEEKARMWQAQAEILSKLGLGHVTIREE